ncbi:UDP-N-acetylmuramyl pentapeptide phosphotransferase [Microbacterium sp. ZXX196]|uniref:UDP-N-acetylmuramyl pentapeptide phosphotransferase n=1 Tax=Microbacterium sp. ZXX196 TaxID=2609291 RepID=UPI0012B9D4A9|nr:UDP-N-acetylmuramyl pentapeptide phosphotransferase [Microbacterium sp. ZXX196]MTE24346.1 UDP-N-acetylmuramyl pentapeptide phosphotransferase [Microbacterium sp. ZXX196]
MTQPSEKTPSAGARAVVADAQDPARRPDVLFRVRRPEGTEPSVWWPIVGFLLVSAGVLAALNLIPG